MLILPIKRKWFDMIVSGEKKEEYREIKPYYDSRFMNAFGFLLVGGQMGYGEASASDIPQWIFKGGSSDKGNVYAQYRHGQARVGS